MMTRIVPLVALLLSSPAFAQPVLDVDFTNLDFRNPSLVEGQARQLNAVYRYDNLGTFPVVGGGTLQLRARVTIAAINNATLTTFDATENPSRFEPDIASSNNNGGSIDFRVDFVDGNNQPVFVTDFAVTAVDIDGSGNNREFVEITAPNSWRVNNPTQLTPSLGQNGRVRFLGRDGNLDGRSFDNTASFIADYTSPLSTLTFRLGLTGQNNTARLFSVALGAPGGVFTNPAVRNPPEVVLTTPATTAGAPFEVTATFSAGVTGFDVSDILTNGTVVPNSFVVVNATTYRFTIAPAGPTPVTVNIPAGAGTGTVSFLPNTASNTLSLCAPGFANTEGTCVAICGDGLVVTGETCDDNDQVGGDGCNTTCRTEVTVAVASPTQVRRPPLTGTGDVGATVQVSIGGFLGTTVVGPDGTWRYTAPVDFPDGTYAVTATATDTRGGVSVATTEVVIDGSTSVAIVAPQSNAVLLPGVATLSGTAEAGATVTVTLSGPVSQTFTLSAPNGTWTTPTNALVPGSYTVTATATDALGNTASAGPVAFSVVVCVDSAIGPDPSCGGATPYCLETGGVASCGACESAAQCDDGNTCTVDTCTAGVCGNTPSAAGTVCGDGVCDGAASPSCVECLIDADCGVGSFCQPDRTCLADTTTSVSITDPTEGASYAPGPRTLLGTREAGASVVVTLTGPVNATFEIGPGDSSWSVVTASLPVGTYQVSAHATDAFGNEAFAGPVTFTVTATCGGAGACDDGNPCTADRCEASGCVNEALPRDSACGDGDVCDGSTTEPACVECTSDAQCGELDCDEARNVCDDLTPPAIELVSPEEGAVFEAREVAIRGQTEPATTVVVTVTDAAGNAETFTVVSDAEGAFEVVAEQLADGDYEVVAVATDASGNSAQDTTSFSVISDEPFVRIDTPVDGGRFNENPPVSGRTRGGASVELVLTDADGEVVLTTTVEADEAGVYTWDLGEALPEGEYTVTATVTEDGVEVSDSATFTITAEDVTPPAVAITEPADGSTTRDRLPVIRGTAEPGAKVVVTIDGEVVGEVTAGEDGTWELGLTTALEDGEHEVTATATDAAGNSATATNTFTVEPDPTDPTDPTDPSAGFTVQGGGCAGGGFAPLAVLGLVLVALRRRLRAFRHHNSA